MKTKKKRPDRPSKQKVRAAREMPSFPKISEEMQQWAAMLKQELLQWPQVRAKPMFGMMGIYRRKRIFAALPVSRGLTSPNSFILRFVPFPPELLERAKSEPRIGVGWTLRTTKWISFELNAEADLRNALWWLNQAYERAK
jgi:hypothetical protein